MKNNIYLFTSSIFHLRQAKSGGIFQVKITWGFEFFKIESTTKLLYCTVVFSKFTFLGNLYFHPVIVVNQEKILRIKFLLET